MLFVVFYILFSIGSSGYHSYESQISFEKLVKPYSKKIRKGPLIGAGRKKMENRSFGGIFAGIIIVGDLGDI